jgi:phage antirepressor YoqD-like protein
MGENKIIKLFTGEKVQTNGREFTKLLGGFGENKPMFTVWQSSELLGKATREIIQNYNNNFDKFELNVDVVDLKSAINQNDSDSKASITNVLKNIGYSQNKLNATSQWLGFSFSGMMKLVKIIESEESWNIYNEFLEDYFKTKAENIVMEKTLEESKQAIIEERKYILGSVLFEKDAIKKMELLERDKKLEEQEKQIDITLAKEKLMEQVQDSLAISERFTNSNKLYDVGEFSKILNIPKFGRNKLFEWMRENKILRPNNEPYQNQVDMNHFKVIPIEGNRFADSKTLIKSQGISYIVKKLIKDGKIESKSYEDIIKNIDQNLKVAN